MKKVLASGEKVPSSPQEASTGSVDLDLDLVWRGLSAEIDFFSARASREGVTTWALVASGAPLIYFALADILTGQSFTLPNVGRLGYQIYCIAAGYAAINSILKPSRNQQNRTIRLISDGSRKEISRAAGLLVAASTNWLYFWWLSIKDTNPLSLRSVVMLIPPAALILVFSAAQVSFRLSIPQPTPGTQTYLFSSPWPRRIIAAAFIITVISSLIISLQNARYLASEVRLAFTPICIIGLFIVRVAMGTPSIVLHSLVSVRRDLYLGKLDAESARNQAELVLLGAPLGTAFQTQLERFREANREFEEMIAESEDCAQKLSTVSPADETVRKALINQIISNLKQAQSISKNRIQRESDSLRTQISIISQWKGPNVFHELEKIVKAVEEATESSGQKLAKLTRATELFRASLQSKETRTESEELAPASETQQSQREHSPSAPSSSS